MENDVEHNTTILFSRFAISLLAVYQTLHGWIVWFLLNQHLHVLAITQGTHVYTVTIW